MKKNNNPSDIASDYAKTGKKMVIQPKKGASVTKTVKVGDASATVKNGIYAPKPTTAAKAAAPAPKKTKFKAPTMKQTGMKMALKKGGKGRKC